MWQKLTLVKGIHGKRPGFFSVVLFRYFFLSDQVGEACSTGDSEEKVSEPRWPWQLIREAWAWEPIIMQQWACKHFLKSENHKSAIENFGIIPLSQICKSLRCFRRQVATPQFLFIFWVYPQITKLNISLVLQSANCESANISPKVNECHATDGKAQVSKSESIVLLDFHTLYRVAPVCTRFYGH